MDKYYLHLKNLFYSDALVTNSMEMNHNAIDRSCIYETFISDIDNNFHQRFDEVLERLEERKTKFKPLCFKSLAEVEEYAEEWAERYMEGSI